MRKPSSILAITTFLATSAALSLAGLAAESFPDGRPLPARVKQEIFKQACNLPESDWELDCTTNTDPTKCRWQRSDGTKFEPRNTANQVAYIARSDLMWNVFSNTNQELELGEYPEDATEDMASFLFRVISGLSLQLENEYPLKLNPAAVAWAERELLPAPSDPLCGYTAQVFYDTNFKMTVQTFAAALVELTKAGYPKRKVDRDRLESEFGSRRGGYWSLCQGIAKRHKALSSERMVSDSCFFWLRRGASSAMPEIAAFTARFVQTYDPTFYAKHEKTFAKVLLEPVAPKTN